MAIDIARMTVTLDTVLSPEAQSQVEQIGATCTRLEAANRQSADLLARMENALAEQKRRENATKPDGTTDLLAALAEVPASSLTAANEAKMRRVLGQIKILAMQLLGELPAGAERTVAIRRLVEVKDCAFRSILLPGGR